MATATATRPSASRTTATPAQPTDPRHTGSEKAVATAVIGVAGAAAVGVFAWAVWVASQISIPV